MNLAQATEDLQDILHDTDITIYTLGLRREARIGIKNQDPLRAQVSSIALQQYKEDIKLGRYRYSPERELRVINALRDDSDSHRKKDLRYLERRFRHAYNRLNNPSPYQSARGNEGGCILPCQMKQYKGFKVARMLLDVLSSCKVLR